MLRTETLLDEAAWEDKIASFPLECQDVYFTRQYHHMHSAAGLVQAHAVVVERDGEKLFVPGLRTAIQGEAGQPDRWDLQTCNGYGGPLASENASSRFLEAAWSAWRRQVASRGCVAAFFRLHPLLQNDRWLPADATVRRDRMTVYVDLSAGVAPAWQRADSRHRNMVTKGQREHVRVEWDNAQAWDDFELLYRQAMERLGAAPALRFSSEYFARMRRLPGAALASVRKEGRLAAAACFMFGRCWAHYHLSARQPDSGNHLTNCILQSAFERAAELGLRGAHLGGGRTDSPSDELLKFKLRTGGTMMEFKIALVVSNAAEYHALLTHWRGQVGRDPQWLLGYRQPQPATNT